MKNRWYAIVAAVALAAAGLVVPSRGAAQSNPARDDRDQSWTRADLERIQRRVEETMRHAQAQLSRQLAELQARHAEIAWAAQEPVLRVQEQLRQRLVETQAQRATALLAAQEASVRARQEVERALAAAQDRNFSVLVTDEGSGWLGVSIQEVTAGRVKELKLPAERGVYVSDVESDSPAAKAGLKAGDVITELNGTRVEGTSQFTRLIRETPAGRTVQLTVWRDGREQTMSAELASPTNRLRTLVGPQARSYSYSFTMPRLEGLLSLARPILGVSIQDVSGQLGKYFGAPDGEGVLITEVNSGSPAEKAGLKAGDVIVKVAGDRVRNSAELRQKLQEKRDQKIVPIGVIRKGAEMTVNVEVEQPKPPVRRSISRRVAI